MAEAQSISSLMASSCKLQKEGSESCAGMRLYNWEWLKGINCTTYTDKMYLLFDSSSLTNSTVKHALLEVVIGWVVFWEDFWEACE